MSRATANRYDELTTAFPLRPIRTPTAHRRALQILVKLASEHNGDAADYKTVLAKLVADYEHTAGHRMDTSDLTAADVVRHLLGERGITVNAFAREIGVSQGTLNDTLLGKRAWSKSVILKVADYFGLSTDLFLRGT